MPFPAWLALIVHVPTATSVTVVPATVHWGAVAEVKATVNPDEAVALTVNVPEPSALSESAPNVIVWSVRAGLPPPPLPSAPS